MRTVILAGVVARGSGNGRAVTIETRRYAT